MSRLSLLALACLAYLACLSCSSSSTTGTAPTITSFVLGTTTLIAGTTSAVDGTVTIEDPDGDIQGLSGEVVYPDGGRVPTQDVSYAAGDAKKLDVTFHIAKLEATALGDYLVTVQARDQQGNQSAKVSATLTAR